ncbi:MAG: sulfite exporter TauE/SafE family protein [Nitrospirae bacterium]|nr:sulfite exporter TauE/SafE family protein [Nitrospirota bacterium]
MVDVDYTLTFIAGILGSFHCMGMCGGLVSAFFLRLGAGDGLMPYLTYHTGRIMIYTLIGTLAASLGMAIEKSGLFGKVQGILQILSGLVVTIIALDILGVLPRRLSIGIASLNSLKRFYNAVTKKGRLLGSFLGGVLNGLIPCSLVFAVAVTAVSTGSPVKGGGLMLVFGIGTLPSMLFVSMAFAKLGATARGILTKLAAYVVLAMGINTIYRGYTFFNIVKGLSDW